MTPFKNSVVLAVVAVTLSGCASVPRDDGKSDVITLMADRGVTTPATDDVKAFSNRVLAAPITAQGAVQLALLNNPELRREFAQLGFSAAELYDAGRLSNPVLSAVRLSPGDPAAANAQLSLGIAVNFTDLLLWHSRKRFSSAQFEATKLTVGDRSLRLAAEVQTSWYDAVVAEQRAQLWDGVAVSAAASAAMAQRYFDAGNISRRRLAMELGAAGSAKAEALRARGEANTARSRLNQAMGLTVAQNTWSFDLRLALPLEENPSLDDLLAKSAKQRLDIASAEQRAAALARRYGLERKARFIGGIEIGFEREKDFDGSVNKGPSLGIELPIFNWGGGRVRSAKAALTLAEADLDETTLAASNEVQRALAELKTSKERVDLYRQTVIPQREDVVARMQEELGYMLIGVFEVITAKQDEYEAYGGYLDALGDYWRARTELARASGGRLPDDDQPTETAIEPSAFLAPVQEDASEEHGMTHDMDDMPGMEGMDGSADEQEEPAEHQHP